MIVKVQRPIMPAPPKGTALVYDRDRKLMAHVPWQEVESFMGEDLKQYRAATYDAETSAFTFGDRIKDQSW